MSAADANSIAHTMAPLTADLEVTGTPVARLWVSADQPDVNVFAALEDVSPEGHSRFVTDGRLRASWRARHPTPWGNSTWNWHRGFAAEELVFDFYPTSYVFRKGHQIRVSIVTSIDEAFHAPPLAGGKPVTLRLYRDAAHPSSIDLPVVAAGQ
jgi:putative CocE/NonD family hydrolase